MAANLNTMGVEASETETLKELNPKVLDIKSGGAPPTTPSDPYEVYHNTRPADWLTMPDVSENEIYLLFHLLPVDNYVAFTITCTGSYTVEYGTVVNNLFVPSGSATFPSGTAYEGTFYYNDWADELSNGKRQTMLRITGINIEAFKFADHSTRNCRNMQAWNTVEFKGNLPCCTSCEVSEGSYSPKLKYFTLEGVNSITNFLGMFMSLDSLIAILALDTSSGTSFDYMFADCTALTALPNLDTGNGLSFDMMFLACTSLTTIPEFDTGSGASFVCMFEGCNSLIAIPSLDLSNGLSFDYMFVSCTALTTIPVLNASSGLNFTGMFYECRSFTSISSLDTSSGTRFDSMFGNCVSLTTIPTLDTRSGTNFGSMFMGCKSLATMPALDTGRGLNFSSMFSECRSLTTIPYLDTSSGTEFDSMFQNCELLTAIPTLDTSNGTEFRYMFQGCKSLTSITSIDTSRGESIDHMFDSCAALNSVVLNISAVMTTLSPFLYCHDLRSIKFLGSTATWSAPLSLDRTSLTAAAVEEFFNTLPPITGGEITLDATPAALQFKNDPDLAARVTAIATGKNWEVSY